MQELLHDESSELKLASFIERNASWCSHLISNIVVRGIKVADNFGDRQCLGLFPCLLIEGREVQGTGSRVPWQRLDV